MRKLASVRAVENVISIEGADSIELVELGGWRCVVKKDEQFTIGSLGVYFEIDSVVPELPEFEFLRNKKFRVKTAKMMGKLSQGLFIPLSILPKDLEVVEGMDVTEILGVKHWDDVRMDSAEYSGTKGNQAKGSFPAGIKRTDEERVQNAKYVTERYKERKFYVAEKADGSSFTAFLKNLEEGGNFGVCSRNLELDEAGGGNFWAIARKLDLENKMREYAKACKHPLVLQGELIGPGIQGNIYNLKEHKVLFFNVIDLRGHQYYSYNQFVSAIFDMGLETVPILDCNFVMNHSVDQLLEMAEGKSVLNPQTEREGIVIRPLEEVYDEDLGRLSIKCVSNRYLLKQK